MTVNNTISNMPFQATPDKPKDDEYINPADGLIYCKKCNTPRQKRMVLFGRPFTPYMMCRCRQEAYEADEAKRRRQEYLNDIAAKRSVGLHDRALRECTFANDLGYNPQIQKAHDYVDKFSQMQENGAGLLLWGGIGTGKTFLAGCIANALIDRQVPILMTTFGRILNTLTGMFQEDRNGYIDSFSRYSLLILDDLGMERSTEFALEQVFNVIDTRYRSKKPMIVTTNLTLEELKHPPDVAHSRIYDRILEVCVPIKINNQNIRIINREANFKEMATLLSGSENSSDIDNS